jgi:hypothetical protein
MAVRDDFAAGEVLAAVDLNDTFADKATLADAALKANLASPTFTGTPAGPTAAANTNTTQLATTAFVYGAYDSIAPTLTNITIGNGDVVTRHRRIGNLVHFYGRITLGSTTVIGTNPQVSVPIGFGLFNAGVGSAWYYDASATVYAAGVCPLFFGTDLNFVYQNQLVSATVPFTWAGSDILQWNITYEAFGV